MVLAALCPCSSLLRHGRVLVCVIQLIAAFLFFGDLAPAICQCSLFDGSSATSASRPVYWWLGHCARALLCFDQVREATSCGTVPALSCASTRARPSLCDTTDRSILVLGELALAIRRCSLFDGSSPKSASRPVFQWSLRHCARALLCFDTGASKSV